jgi:hypothetical protein
MTHSRILVAAAGVSLCLVGFALIPMAAERAGAVEPAVDTRPAVEAAETWLQGIDTGDYASSWDQAAELFRNAVARDAWAHQLRAVREPLGALGARKLRSAQAHASLPGVPDGRYVVMEFAASYANKNSAIETLSACLEPDGAWRVAGYFIR